jgi:Domain of unknown function (DUF5615)
MGRALAHALRARGVDATTALAAGMIGRSDADHLDYATAQERTLYTFNVKHFYRLHASYTAQGKHHAGIILARQQRYSVGEQMRRLLRLIATKSAEEIRDSVEFLQAWG